MSVVTSHTTAVTECPACKSTVVFRFESTTICVCTTCRSQVTRGGLKLGQAMPSPSDDMSKLRVGASGKQDDKTFTVTGRIRFIFDDDGYVNLWHVETGGRGNNWIAESFHTYAFLKEDEASYPLSHLLLLKPGDKFTSKSIHYYLSSSETKTSVEAEGELPEEVPEEKIMYVVGTSPDKLAVHFHVFNRNKYRAYRGKNMLFSEFNFSNTRAINS